MSDILLLFRDARTIADALPPMPEGIHLHLATAPEEAAELLGKVRGLIAMPQALDQALIERMPRLEWLQTLTAGIDPLAALDLGDVVVSTASGTQGPQMAELALLFMLALTRDIRAILDAQKAAQWRPRQQRMLAGQHVVIVGVGRIAEALAMRCRAFEMRVTGISSSRIEAPGFDAIRPTAELTAAAEDADYLVVLSPYSARTHHLVSRAVLAALRPHTILVNLGRGPVVDEAALAELLTEGRIGGAGLDVFEREPLPPESPLWRLPNVILTPHVGGWSTSFAHQIAPLIIDNIGRWFGHPRRRLHNQID